MLPNKFCIIAIQKTSVVAAATAYLVHNHSSHLHLLLKVLPLLQCLQFLPHLLLQHHCTNMCWRVEWPTCSAHNHCSTVHNLPDVLLFRCSTVLLSCSSVEGEKNHIVYRTILTTMVRIDSWKFEVAWCMLHLTLA